MTDPTAPASTNRSRIRAARGATLSCKSWQQEAALRMLMNSLDPEVAERPENLIVHSGEKVVRDWAFYDALVAALRALENDETLLVQSGKPVGIFRTHARAPRVLIANTSLAEDNRAGLASYSQMLGQMSAASWMYTGTQGALHGTYLIFAAAAQEHFGGTPAGKLVVAGGLGATGGAQSLAATLNGGAFLGIDVDPERIKRCVKAGYCDVMVNDLDESLRILKNAVRKSQPASVGLVGNCADLIPALAERGVVPDLLTDQTPAHDPLNGYIPRGLDVAAATELRARDPQEYRRRALDSIAIQLRGMLDLQKLGALTFDSVSYIRTLLAEGRAPLLCVALSGEPSDIYRADALLIELFPQNEILARWIRMIGKRVRFAGLPARTCWLAHDEAVKFALALNDLVARGELKAPMLIGRGHFGGGTMASPHSGIEVMRDGSDEPVDWPLLNALLNAAGGASWLAIQNGSAGTAYSLHIERALVADGVPEMAERIELVFAADSENGAARPADAAYFDAIEATRKSGAKIPKL